MPIGIYYSPKSMTAAQYNQIIGTLAEAGVLGPDNGCLSHTCFGEEGSLHVFDVFESKPKFDTFAETLFPAIKKAGVDFKEPTIVEIVGFAAVDFEYQGYQTANA